MNKLEFMKCMKILQASYMKDFDESQLQAWYIQFQNIKYEVLEKAINKLVRVNKYLPSIAEILEECDKYKGVTKHEVLEYMRIKGYFKVLEEYEKAQNWVAKGLYPEWFAKDMKEYHKALFNDKELDYIPIQLNEVKAIETTEKFKCENCHETYPLDMMGESELALQDKICKNCMEDGYGK